jgi:hypothetical protein
MSLSIDYKPFDLPGAAYYKAANLPVPATVNLRHLTVSELRYFSKITNLDYFIDKILQSCLEGGAAKFDTDLLLTGDRIYMFYMIRALTVGEKYSFEIECSNPNCGQKLGASANLFELPVKKFDETIGYPIHIHLPKANKGIDIALFNRQMEKEVETEVAKAEKEAPNTEPNEPVFRLWQMVKNVEGLTPVEAHMFLTQLHYLDWRAIEKVLTQVTPGLDLDATIKCDKCMKITEFSFSLRPKEFFLLGD